MIKKWRQMPEEAKSTIVFVISSFIVKGIVFITTPIFTRIMPVFQYGIIATFNSWRSIIEVFALLGLTSAGVFNVGLNDYRDARDQYVSSVLTLCNAITIVTFTVIFAYKNFFTEEFLLPNNQLILMFVWLLFSPAQDFWLTRQKYEYKYKLAFCVTVVIAILSQIIAVIAVMNIDAANLGEIKLWSTNLTTVILVLPIYIHIFVKGKNFFDFKRWKQILVFALPLIPHYLAQHIMFGADRILLSKMISDAAAGIYSVVNNIGLIASIVWSSVNASLIAYTFENLNKKQYGGVNHTVTMLLIGYAAICVCVTVVAPEIMRILAPEEYYSGIYAIPPIICVSFLSALYNVYANVEFYHKKSVCIAISTIIATLVNVLLNIVLIPRFTFVGAAYTTLISYVVLIVMHYIGYRKCNEPVYKNRNIAVIALGCVLACMLCNLLYINNLIRFSVMAFLILLFVWKRKFIINALKILKNKG